MAWLIGMQLLSAPSYCCTAGLLPKPRKQEEEEVRMHMCLPTALDVGQEMSEV